MIPQLTNRYTYTIKYSKKKSTDKEWQYLNYGNPISPQGNIIGAFDGEKLIGINTFMLMKYTYNNEYYYGLQSGNSAIDPNYRGKGIFTKMMKYAEDYYSSKNYQFMLGFPNRNSHPAFTKMGWTDAASLHYLILQLNTNEIIKRVFGFNLPKICNIFSGWLNLKSHLFSRKNPSLKLERHEKITPEISGLVSSLSKNSFTFVNDFESLQWKLANPIYIFYTVKEDDRIVAFFIVREHTFASVIGRKAEVIETCYVSDDLKLQKSAYSIFIQELRKKFELILSWNSLNSNTEKKILKSSGYFDVHLRMPYVIKILTKDPEIISILERNDIWSPQEIEINTVIQYVEKYE